MEGPGAVDMMDREEEVVPNMDPLRRKCSLRIGALALNEPRDNAHGQWKFGRYEARMNDSGQFPQSISRSYFHSSLWTSA